MSDFLKRRADLAGISQHKLLAMGEKKISPFLARRLKIGGAKSVVKKAKGGVVKKKNLHKD